MIIRIMGEGQYRVPDSLIDELNRIDNRIVEHVSAGAEKEFRQDLDRLIGTIKGKGTALPAEEIVESQVIVPPSDMSLDEARKVFNGPGLIED
ncbi:MAG: hypothetical protein JW986_03760 [Methanotrichaceae archaeon]|nr:hypothetical protein [Methanotrichaceae archaeon]